MPYFLPEAYVERLQAPQSYDEEGGDFWQDEVYATALKLAKVLDLKTVLDFGCGSGFKLMKYFREFTTLGADLPPAVERLNNKYPERSWCTPDDISEELRLNGLLGLVLPKPNLLICSDVLEHLDNPDVLCNQFKLIRPGWLVISTPDRELMAKYPKWTTPMGPPGNPCHVREWTFEEFRRYIAEHFNVIRHFHSNVKQCTQCLIARPKGKF
jgi:SAM-dependent methyltransferase